MTVHVEGSRGTGEHMALLTQNAEVLCRFYKDTYCIQDFYKLI